MKKFLIIAVFFTISLTSLSAATMSGTDKLKVSDKALFAKCIACHGASGEKKALGKSAIIKGWSKKKIVKALKGYKDGTYGKAMKGIMKAQVATLTNKQISQLAVYISKMK